MPGEDIPPDEDERAAVPGRGNRPPAAADGPARALCPETSDRSQQAEALTRTGDVRLREGRPREACDRFQEALALYQEIGDRSGEADALNSLGEALLVAGQPSRARTRHTTACDI